MATDKKEKEKEKEQEPKKKRVKGGSENTKKKSPTTNAKKIWKPALMEKDEKDIMLRPSDEWKANTQTVERVIYLAKMISEGQSRQKVQEWIMTNYEVGDRQARAYYSAALRYLIPDNEEEYKKGMIQANINRLENIIERTMTEDDADFKNAIAAIREINRILEPKEKNTIEVASNDVAFRIKFGSD